MNTFTQTMTKTQQMGLTENGALTYTSLGTALLDQFGKAGSYRLRSIEDVFDDQEALWKEDADKALRFIFYLRNITRQTVLHTGDKTTKVSMGQGNRDEAFKRLLWVAKYQPATFYGNLLLLPLVGSWKDLWQLLYMDQTLGVGAITDRHKVYETIMMGLKYAQDINLIKKYMPRIKASKKCTTDWTRCCNCFAKELAEYMGMSYKTYNKFKATGNAHTFQKLISAQRWEELDFNTIPGRALTLLIRTKFLSNHGLSTKFADWAVNENNIKFTGYAYDLLHTIRHTSNDIVKLVTDKQFDTLIELASKDSTITENVWCALDTSGSMSHIIDNKTLTAFDVCIGLGLYFSTLNKGAFHKNVVMFDNVSTPLQLQGSFSEMYRQITNCTTAWGSTNFQSVIDALIRVRRQHPEIPLDEFPKTLLVISDMEFNDAGRFGYSNATNHEAAVAKLREEFPDEFVDNMKFIWWDCVGRTNSYPANAEEKGNYFFSGFDGSIISTLLGEEVTPEVEKPVREPKTMDEIINIALSQEIFNLLEIF